MCFTQFDAHNKKTHILSVGWYLIFEYHMHFSRNHRLGVLSAAGVFFFTIEMSMGESFHIWDKQNNKKSTNPVSFMNLCVFARINGNQPSCSRRSIQYIYTGMRYMLCLLTIMHVHRSVVRTKFQRQKCARRVPNKRRTLMLTVNAKENLRKFIVRSLCLHHCQFHALPFAQCYSPFNAATTAALGFFIPFLFFSSPSILFGNIRYSKYTEYERMSYVRCDPAATYAIWDSDCHPHDSDRMAIASKNVHSSDVHVPSRWRWVGMPFSVFS